MAERVTILKGKILQSVTGDEIFDARVRHVSSRRSTNTDADGTFKFQIPRLPQGAATKLVVTAEGFFPKVAIVKIEGSPTEIRPQLTAVRPLKGEGKWKILIGVVSSLLSWWYGASPREQLFAFGFVTLLLIPTCIVAIGLGVDIPFTDADEYVRERLQLFHLSDIKIADVRFHSIQQRYRAGVRYVLPSGSYEVTKDILIDADRLSHAAQGAGEDSLDQRRAVVKFEPGVKLSFKENTGILCYGKLVATGGSDQKDQITLEPKVADKRWSNITFWGGLTQGSRLQYCLVTGGGGRHVLDSIAGAPTIVDDGQLRGGGALIYDTTVVISDCTFQNCQAEFGGAVYMRDAPQPNPKKPSPRRGSNITNVRFAGCKAISGNATQLTGGGAIFLKYCYPQLLGCTFEGNEARSRSSCGGAIYVGDKSRIRLDKCAFRNNLSDAEGGAIYALSGEIDGDDHTCGVVIIDSGFRSNKGHGSGGAIATSNSRISISGCTFDSNEVHRFMYELTKKASARGGAVSIEWTRPYEAKVPNRISNTTFDGNSVIADQTISEKEAVLFCGGALHYWFSSAAFSASFDTMKLRFASNNAPSGMHVAAPEESKQLLGHTTWDNETTFGSPAITDENAEAYYGDVPTVYTGKSRPPDIVDNIDQGRQRCDARPTSARISSVLIYLITTDDPLAGNAASLDLVSEGLRHQYGCSRNSLSVHYTIQPNAQVHRWVPEESRAWHAEHLSLSDGKENLDDTSIAIAIMVPKGHPCSDEQIDMLARLLCDLRRRHPAIKTETVYEASFLRFIWAYQRNNNSRESQQLTPPPELTNPGLSVIPLYWSRLAFRLAKDNFE